MKTMKKNKMEDTYGTPLETNKHKRTMRPSTCYYLMLLPGILLLLIFNYIPMGGVLMAFQDYSPVTGFINSPWVGLKHFKTFFNSVSFKRILRNTIVIALGKMTLTTLLAIVFAIMINEIRVKWLKKTIQTVSYLPHFMSWVILAAIVTNLFNMAGPVNAFLEKIGMEPMNFLGKDDLFQPLLIYSDVWKGFGYSSIIYLAAITAVDPALHEAAAMDGANWWQRVWHVTLPAMLPIIILTCCLNVTGILNAGFDQIYNLYTPVVFESSDIIDTYVYRAALKEARYSFGTAIGLFKSVIGFVLMISMNELSKKFANRSVF